MTEAMRMDRAPPIQRGSERAMLESMLDFYRATVVKHLAGTERFWFSIDFAALDVPWPWLDDDVHGNFRIEPGDTLAAIVADYVEECARSRRAVAEADLDDPARGEDMDFTLRYALIHMVQETARHCGHLDLLREVTDGAVGG
jgi:hypothetical protein